MGGGRRTEHLICEFCGWIPYGKNAGTMSNTGVGLTVGRGGEASTGDAYMNGKVSTTKFYNRALSASEIQQNFNATRGRYGI